MANDNTREVTLRLGTTLKTGGDEALRKLGRATEDLKRQQESVWQGMDKSLQAITRSISMAEAAFRRLGRNGSRELDQLNAKLEKFDRGFRDVARKGLSGNLVGVHEDRLNVSDTGRRSAGDRIGHAFGRAGDYAGATGLTLPTTALAAFAGAVKLADIAVKNFYGSIERGKYSPEASKDNWFQSLQSVPIVGEWLKHKSRVQNEEFWGGTVSGGVSLDHLKKTRALQEERGASKSGWSRFYRGSKEGLLRLVGSQSAESAEIEARENADAFNKHAKYQRYEGVATKDIEGYIPYDWREFRAFRSRQKIGQVMQATSAQMGAFGQESTLRMQKARLGADVSSELGMRRQAYARLGAESVFQERAIARTQGKAGYAREQQLEDVFRQIGFGKELSRIGSEGAASLSNIGTMQKEADLRQGALAGRHQQATRERQAAENRLGKRNAQGQLVVRGDISVPEEVRLRDELTAAYEKESAIAQQLQQAQKTSLDLREQRERSILQIQNQQTAAIQGQLSALNAGIQAEQRRKAGMKEDLALMHPRKLASLVGVERKFQKGLPMTQRDLELMRSAPGDMFKGQLQQIAARRAKGGMQGAMIQELMRGTGQEAREKELRQQKVVLEQKIALSLKVDEKSLAGELEKKVFPALMQAIGQVKATLEQRINQLENQRWTQQRAQFGQF